MTSTKKRILVVDDEEDIVELIRYNLTKEGFDVVPARNGKEALQKAIPPPDLVILDLMMPVMDGFDTCRRLKVNPATKATPVVFLTASASEVDEVVGLELGADPRSHDARHGRLRHLPPLEGEPGHQSHARCFPHRKRKRG